MSNDFDKAVSFLQGALNAAAFEVASENTPEEKLVAQEAPAVEGTPVPEEEPVTEETHVAAEASVIEEEPVATEEPVVEETPVVSEEPVAAEPPVVDETFATPTCPCATEKPEGVRLSKLAASLVIAVCTGVAIVAAHKLIHPRVVEKEVIKEVQVEPDGIPFALLPDYADPSLWDTVTCMSGTINGVELQFKRGVAEANGTTYKIGLDFCRSGNNIYVRVTGNGNWVAQVNADGKILRTFPVKSGNKPLKEIFAK